MRAFVIELKKEKRTGVVSTLLIAGVLGALYACANFMIRKETLLNLPLDPMDILLTQLYGMILLLNMFGIIVATCIIYNMEFKGGAIRKIYVLPIDISKVYFSKFIVLTTALIFAILLQDLTLMYIGLKMLPMGTFDMSVLIHFAIYSFLTSMPVLTFMLLISSRFENMWVSLGIGVAGFLSGMALAPSNINLCFVHPFVVMLKPAVAMTAQPNKEVIVISMVETIIFLAGGVLLAKRVSYE